MFRRVSGYGLVRLRSRGAGSLASPDFSGTRPAKTNMRIQVDRKRELPR